MPRQGRIRRTIARGRTSRLVTVGQHFTHINANMCHFAVIITVLLVHPKRRVCPLPYHLLHQQLRRRFASSHEAGAMRSSLLGT